MSARRRRHDEEHEEHVNHERWLITYADMITLLMVLFIVLFAMSQIDQNKFNALRQSLSVGFGEQSPLTGAQSPVNSQDGSSATYAIKPTELGNINGPAGSAAADAQAKTKQDDRLRKYGDVRSEADRLEKIRQRILAALAARGLTADVRTTLDGRGLTVSLISQHVVFDPNVATLSPRGQRIVDAIGPVLASLSDNIEIEGHTNQQGGHTAKYYASDWDLAAARAVTVLRRLTDVHGVADTRVQATSFGKSRPLVPSSQPNSQRLNKRVDIVVLAHLTDEERQLLSEVVANTQEKN